MIDLFFSSTIKEGAVPFGFFIIIDPSGNIACLSLFLVGINPLFLNLSSISLRDSWSVKRFLLVTFATISLVISSLVGPIPPDVITISALSREFFRIAFILSGLSPTIVLKNKFIPFSANLRDIQAEFESTICPNKSSDPIATISAFIVIYYKFLIKKKLYLIN